MIQDPDNHLDSPQHAMMMTDALDICFRDFKIYFEPETSAANTCRIKTFLPAVMVLGIPVTRELPRLPEDQSIPTSSSRLLAIHAAIAHILHHSRVGRYMNNILQDYDELINHLPAPSGQLTIMTASSK